MTGKVAGRVAWGRIEHKRRSLARLVCKAAAVSCLAVLVAVAMLSLAGCGNPSPTSTTLVAPPPSETSTTANGTSTTTTAPSPTTTVALSTTTTGSSSTTTTAPTTTTGLSHTSVTIPGGKAVLSPQQLAGQRIIYSYTGLTPPSSLLQLIREGKAAGVVFFSDNISSVAQIRSVIAELEEADQSPQNPVRAPLLLMTDQEGGTIRRLPGAPLLSEKAIGASADPVTEATQAGTQAGVNLSGAGMNANLAPVLDVYRAPGDFIDQSGRSYSTDPHLVSTLGAAFIKAQQEEGVAATAKHFPGLGAATASQNTDLRPVTLGVSLATLHSTDELPYKAAVSAGVRMIMVSWAIYPALSPRPAGFSSIVVQRELRGRLGFQGVTITDALGAGALKAFGTGQHRAVLAAGAGMDLILCSGGQDSLGSQAKDGLAAAFLDGSLSGANFQRSAQRVVDLRFSLSD